MRSLNLLKITSIEQQLVAHTPSNFMSCLFRVDSGRMQNTLISFSLFLAEVVRAGIRPSLLPPPLCSVPVDGLLTDVNMLPPHTIPRNAPNTQTI